MREPRPKKFSAVTRSRASVSNLNRMSKSDARHSDRTSVSDLAVLDVLREADSVAVPRAVVCGVRVPRGDPGTPCAVSALSLRGRAPQRACLKLLHGAGIWRASRPSAPRSLRPERTCRRRVNICCCGAVPGSPARQMTGWGKARHDVFSDEGHEHREVCFE
jgi:hypothetical protein